MPVHGHGAGDPAAGGRARARGCSVPGDINWKAPRAGGAHTVVLPAPPLPKPPRPEAHLLYAAHDLVHHRLVPLKLALGARLRLGPLLRARARAPGEGQLRAPRDEIEAGPRCSPSAGAQSAAPPPGAAPCLVAELAIARHAPAVASVPRQQRGARSRAEPAPASAATARQPRASVPPPQSACAQLHLLLDMCRPPHAPYTWHGSPHLRLLLGTLEPRAPRRAPPLLALPLLP